MATQAVDVANDPTHPLFRLMVQAVEEYGLFLLDTEGHIASWNTGARRLQGYDADEIVGQHFSKLYPPEDREKGIPARNLRLALEKGRYASDGWRVRKDGSYFFAHVVITPLYSDDGELLGFAKVSHDRSREHEAERDLRESERRYRRLVDLIPQHVWVAEPDGRITYVSRRWQSYTGLDAEDFQDDRWQDLIHADDRERAVGAWKHSLATGEPYAFEVRMRGADGIYRWFLERGVPERNDEGEIVRWIGTLTDVDEQKGQSDERQRLLEQEQADRERAEERAREERALREAVAAVGARFSSEEITQVIVDQAVSATQAAGAIMTTIVKVRNEVNIEATSGEVPPVRDRFDYDTSFTRKVIEESMHPLVPRLANYEGGLWPHGLPPEYLEWSMLIVPLRLGEEAFGSLLLFRAPDQPTFDEEEVQRALTFGQLTGIAFEKIRLLEQEAARREELERVSESRTRLMRGFGHDVKNPLGAADGFAQLLEDGVQGELTEEQMESVAGIRRSIQTSLQLIGDLMELARAESGQIEVQVVPSNLADLVRESVDDFRAQATAEGLALEVPAQEDLSVETDPLRVKQIVSNLLSNALKYTEQGTVTVQVRADPAEEPPRPGHWVCVQVADTGPGIPEDKQASIFQEFTRLDPDAPHGAGVGLAISQRIAHLLNGEITVESTPGEGSTFSLWLPAD